MILDTKYELRLQAATTPALSTPEEVLEHDRRWRAWLAKGVRHDARVRDRMRWVALLGACTLIALSGWVMLW